MHLRGKISQVRVGRGVRVTHIDWIAYLFVNKEEICMYQKLQLFISMCDLLCLNHLR